MASPRDHQGRGLHVGRGLLLLLGKGGSRDVTAHTAGCTLSWTERCGRHLGWGLLESDHYSGSWDLSGAKGWVQGTEVSLSIVVLKFGCMGITEGLVKTDHWAPCPAFQVPMVWG